MAALVCAGFAGMGLLGEVTLGFGSVVVVAVAAVVARRAFLERIKTLKQSLEQAPMPPEERNDLQPEVLAFARRQMSKG
jgi:hypothetical protein